MRAWIAAACAALALGAAGEFRSPLNGDVAYMLDAARRMLAGQRLYADLLDLNPPFMFWLSGPAAWLGAGPDAATVFRVMMLAALVAVLIIAWPLTRGLPSLRAGYLLMALALPLGHFGEREHLILALVFPYIAVAAVHAGGASVGRRGAIAAGLLAGAGMALKPPAVLLALALAALQWRRERSLRALLRPEHLAVAAALVVSLALIALFTPAYFGMVSEYGRLYAGFSHGTLAQLLTGHLYAVFTCVALVLAVLMAPSVARRGTLAVLGLAAAALFAGAVAQGKGFGYHYLPAFGVAVMALIELVIAAPNARIVHGGIRRVSAALVLLVMLAAPVAVALDRARGRADDRFPERQALAAALADLAPGARIAILSVRLGDAYPLLLDRRLEHVLSMPHLWFAGVQGDSAASGRLWRRAASDLAAGSPEAVVARAPGRGAERPGDIAFDYVQRLCREPEGRKALAEYGLTRHVAGYDIYRKTTRGERPCVSS